MARKCFLGSMAQPGVIREESWPNKECIVLYVYDILNHQIRTLISWQPLSMEKNCSWPGRPLVTSDPDRPSYSKPTVWIRRRPCTFWKSLWAWTRPWIVGPRMKLLPIICMPATNNDNRVQLLYWTNLRHQYVQQLFIHLNNTVREQHDHKNSKASNSTNIWSINVKLATL